jgi:XTP/dITP diphosphohydrolase
VYFATGNKHKYLEAARIASPFGVNLRHLRFEKLEIQSQNLIDIASFAARQAAETTGKVVVAEDAGFFVRELDGFPGPYSSYTYDTIGLEGILRLMKGAKNREASFQAALAYCEPGKRAICFKGIVKGDLTSKPRGAHGFGFDPIFVPRQGTPRTFAEMSTEEKNLLSHRAKAFREFCRWFTENQL